MLASPAQESEIMTQLLALKNDPVGFVQYAYSWGAPGTALERVKQPRRWQLDDFVKLADYTQEQAFRFENGLPLKVQ